MSAPRSSNLSLADCPSPLGIAISGGSDSTALLYRAIRVHGASHVCAVTVDHGLRPAAAGEAELVAELCSKLGVPHDILTLEVTDGPDLQARARAARYDALSRWGRDQKLPVIALGHTSDDQAETVLMRLARGSGVDGLAAMKAQFERDGMDYVRPLLGESRSMLRAELRDAGIAWIDDPSNLDFRFDRVAIRQAMPALAQLGITPQRLGDTAHWMRSAQIVLENAADAWIAEHARADYTDAVLDRKALREAADDTAYRALARILCAISGNPYRPRFSALESLRRGQPATLHGCLIYLHKSELRITREWQAVKTSPDPRWRITGTSGDLRALGDEGLKQLPDWRDTALLPRRSLLASPALWRNETLVAAPFAKPQKGVEAHVPHPLLLAK